MWLVGRSSVAAIGSQTANMVSGTGSVSSIAWSAAEPVSHAAHSDEKKMIARGRSTPALNSSFTDDNVSRVRLGSATPPLPAVPHAAITNAGTTKTFTTPS